MTIIGLEIDFDIRLYLVIHLIVSGGISILFFISKSSKINLIFIPGIIIVSLFFTYILTISIIMYETENAYLKITSIPKSNLIQFYETRDINSIPKNKRHAWIGALYREIEIIPQDRIDKIKVVGWNGNSVFAFYDIEDDDYLASYH